MAIIDCGHPILADNIFIGNYSNTTEGTIINFSCQVGFFPTYAVTATCTADGIWDPDPANHNCHGFGEGVS